MAKINCLSRAAPIFVVLAFLALTTTCVLSLNVDEADAALDETGAPSFTQEDADALADNLDEQDENDSAADREDFDANEENDSDAAISESDDMSFLEDGDQADMDEEDFDFDGMNEEQAQEVANTLSGEERQAFLDLWEEHKANNTGENVDPEGAFAEL
ncbi:conserved hypothetical protein [Neospora caninum Liverpool]|uniref:Transmembrane protein n=1 Tax=Neospora caninum (strain Liverpool) TaxID=572307 RepID=F0VFK7_NEOCL|nr:conserved hypothetical protein [Neospora caninum Liverpool]CBZ52501.1 conserved hypothetical protein [Neospora caninum Liverpool]CEL66478.1 TPA: hypothetical protein BN1204_022900 [Neospora caninum Liverpool]|eukprot:XP_003882533.1 conserved hypothetical protein [Neospora caninum Liverpool]